MLKATRILLLTAMLAPVLAQAAEEEAAMAAGPHEMPMHAACMAMPGGAEPPFPGAMRMGPADVMFFNGPLPGPSFGDPMQLVRLARHLGLSEEQRKAIGAIVDEVQPKVREVLFSLADSRFELEAAMRGEVGDEKQLRELVDKQGKLQSELMFLHLQTRSRIQAELTPEQRSRMAEGPMRHGPEGMKGGFMRHRMHGPNHPMPAEPPR